MSLERPLSVKKCDLQTSTDMDMDLFYAIVVIDMNRTIVSFNPVWKQNISLSVPRCYKPPNVTISFSRPRFPWPERAASMASLDFFFSVLLFLDVLKKGALSLCVCEHRWAPLSSEPTVLKEPTAAFVRDRDEPLFVYTVYSR